jgi:two-component system, OmpR family, response regulator
MPSLLIVDDDPAIREIFTLILREHGYVVESAGSAQECLDALTRTTPDLILLDIMMYPVDGWETLTSIRKTPRTAAIPVMMFSGKSPSRAEISQYGEWIEDYLMKPISVREINKALKSVFDRVGVSQAERELFLQNGGDPRLVDEYFSLKRFLYIHSKYSRDLQEGPDDAGQTVILRKTRFEELGRLLSTRTCRDDPARDLKVE